MVSGAKPFVGRERELDVLRSLLCDAAGGRGRLALLAGEAGIGKTRLADELAAEAAAAGGRVLWGRCWEDAGAPAYWPWVQIVRAYAATVDAALLGATLGGGAADVAQVIPELLERLPGLAAPPAIEPERARFRFFDSMAAFLTAVATRQPLVLVLDDLHWADGSTLVLARFVARTLRDAGLLVLGTYRTDEVDRDPTLAAALADLAREAEVVPLAGLAVADVGRFIEGTVGGVPSRDTVATIHRRTGGNPLFVSELVRLLGADGALDDPARAAAIAVPAGVAQTIRRRLDRLSAPCRTVLETAAVIGVECDRDVLDVARAARAGEPSLHELLAEAVAAGVVAAEPRAGRMRFTHALLRDVLYEALEPRERSALHAHIADALARRADVERRVDEVAHHALHALPLGPAETAITWGIRAAEQAAARLAFEDAGRRYDDALALLRAGGAVDARRECEFLIAAAEAWRDAGVVETGQRRADEAARIARRHGFADGLGRAAVARAHFARTGGGEPGIVALLEEALSALADGDELLRAHVQLKLSNVLAWDGAADRRKRLADEAVAIVRRTGDRRATAQALLDWHWALWGVDNLDERLAAATEMVAIAEATGDRKVLLDALSVRIPDLLETGDVAAVDAAVAAYAALADEIRDRFRSWHTPLFQSVRALLAGRLDDAERATLDAMAAGEQPASAFALRYGGAQLFALRREQGRLDEIEPAARALAAEYPDNRGWRAALAFLYAEVGREVEARAELAAVTTSGLDALPRDHNWLITVAFVAQAAATLGDVPQAAATYALLRPFAGRTIVVAPGIACTGAVAHLLGVLATALGRYDVADEHFADALAGNTRLRAVPFVAHTQREWAAMLRVRGRPGDAARADELAARARAIYERLGMRWALERLPPAAASPSEPRGANVFARSGDQWVLAYDGETVRLRHGKGLGYLAELLRRPGRHVHVIDLAGTADVREGDTSPRPDAEARAAYRRRVEEVRSELAEAEERNDLGRAASLREELEHLGAELAAAYGFGGVSARSRGQVERVRKAVTKCIREDIARIGRYHDRLARHLQNAVRTGTFCLYRPERPTVWER